MATEKPFAISLAGEKVLLRRLEKLGSKVAKKVLRKAVRAGAAPVRKAMRQKAPRAEESHGPNKIYPGGQLKRSIKTKVKTYARQGTVVGIVGSDWDISKTAHFTEGGTVFRTHKSGKNVGATPELSWMQRAFFETGGASRSRMLQKLRAEIDKEARRG